MRENDTIFVRTEFIDVLVNLGLMKMSDPGVSGVHRSRMIYETAYIILDLRKTIVRLGLGKVFKFIHPQMV